ncbi:unnamed protein product [Menidia menidia]|uniref:(Atlantic silverside) hypothetical protein n=1 Tax=Menidia menidia TaxID=238744 RepID=A0A8S4AKT8_9TELE|nr:unnamed protein product [Menidia menidia]
MGKRGGKAKASSSDAVASHGAENEPMGDAEDETGVQREIDIVGRPHLSASRIDYIFVSKSICQLVTQVNIGPIGLSDHAPVALAMQPLRHIERSASWRMSTVSLLDDKFVRRKPKIKLEILQLPRALGGWGLPNIENYALSVQARIISAWIHGHPDSPWLNIETSLCKPSSPVNMLGRRLNDLPQIMKDNQLICNVLWAWGKLRKLFKSSHRLNMVSTLIDNPDLLPQDIGSSFLGWHKAGIIRLSDLFEHGAFKSFDSLKTQYALSNKEFYKYLQVRHYVMKEAKSLIHPTDSYRLEKFLLENKDHKHFISKFYSEIYQLNLDKLAWLRKSWETLLKCEISTQLWDKTLLLPSKISVCNRFKEMQYNILHNVYISPYIFSKYNAGTSPNCLKCKISVGTRFHCLWECDVIQSFWKDVCAKISTAIGEIVSENPLTCLLGHIPKSLAKYEHVIQSLLMLARKAIMVKWVGSEPPSISLWKSLISDVMTLIRLGHYIDGSLQFFTNTWRKPLETLGVEYWSPSPGRVSDERGEAAFGLELFANSPHLFHLLTKTTELLLDDTHLDIQTQFSETVKLRVLGLQLAFQIRQSTKFSRWFINSLMVYRNSALREESLRKASLLAGQTSVSLFQPSKECIHHIQAGRWNPIPCNREPCSLQKQIQLRCLFLQTVNALSDQSQLRATVLQEHRVTARGPLNSGNVFVHSTQGHEESIEGAGGRFALPDLLSELIQACFVSLNFAGQREALSRVEITVQAVDEVHHVVLRRVDLSESGAERAASPLKVCLLAAPLLLQLYLLLLYGNIPTHLGTLGALRSDAMAVCYRALFKPSLKGAKAVPLLFFPGFISSTAMVLRELSHVCHDGLLIRVSNVHICINIAIIHDQTHFSTTFIPYLWHCSRTQSKRAFLAETLKRLWRADPFGGTGLLLAERLERVERVSKLARDSMED